MFIGHYAPAFALKKFDKNISLGLLFLAAQLVDILWAIFIFLGIEKMKFAPEVTGSFQIDLYYMPYTHSLVASLLWFGAVYVVFRLIPAPSGSKKSTIAFLMAITVFSHFILDLIVHRPDLPLYNDTLKMGLGLWNYPIPALIVELLIYIGALWIYLRSTTGGKLGVIIFAVFQILMHVGLMFGPPPPGGIKTLPVVALMSYLLFAGLAYLVDRKRS